MLDLWLGAVDQVFDFGLLDSDRIWDYWKVFGNCDLWVDSGFWLLKIVNTVLDVCFFLNTEIG